MSHAHTPDPEGKAPSQRRATDRFLAVMQGATDLFWILSSTGRMDDITPNWLSFTGQQERDARGNGWLDAVYASDRPSLETFLAQPIFADHVFEQPCHIRRKDGIYRLMHLQAFPVYTFSGMVYELIMGGIDITIEHMNDAQMQLALETSGVGLWRYHLGTQHLVATQQWKRLYGLPPDAPVTFETFLALVHPDDRARIEEVSARAYVESGTHDVQFRITRPDGSLRWMTSQLQSMVDIPNQPGLLIGSTLDITEVKVAEERVTQILESITDAFLHLDQEWRVTYANHHVDSLLGLTASPLSGQSLWNILPAWRETPFEQHLRKVMETQQTIYFESSDPSEQQWYEVHAYPLKQEGLSLYVHDITERKRAEAELRESETRFRHFVDANLLGIIVHDQEGNILEANDKFLSLIEATREDVTTTGLCLEVLTRSDYQSRDRQAREELLATGTYSPFEKIYRTKEGKQVPVLVGGTLMHPEHASSSLILTFALDLTPQKEMERQMQFFFGMTSHELKIPLVALKGMFQLLQRKKQRLLSTQFQLDPQMRTFFETLSERLTDAVRQVDIQTRLINDLLDLSRIQAGTLKLEVQPCDLVSVIKATMEDLRLTSPERTLQLILPAQTTVIVLADQDRIRQVLTNYVTNALRYSRPSLPIVVGLMLQEGLARVWVSDQGPGLAPEAQKDIWLRYHQLESTPIQWGDAGKGLGLGLYICQALIHQQQGEVGVESAPGEGSTFWFTLPVVSS